MFITDALECAFVSIENPEDDIEKRLLGAGEVLPINPPAPTVIASAIDILPFDAAQVSFRISGGIVPTSIAAAVKNASPNLGARMARTDVPQMKARKNAAFIGRAGQLE
jgi:hypothetical protein